MADITSSSNYSLSLIEEKIYSMNNDINTMIEKKQISNEAAVWLLSELKIMAELCKDGLTEDEDRNIPKPLSF